MEKVVLRALDPHFKYEIAGKPGAENIKKCFSCGTCTSGCPVFQVEYGYNPRKLIRMVLLGMRKEVLSSKMIWLCARCYACTANCPQDVSFADIMTVLRDMAVQEGYAKRELMEKIENLTRAAHEFRKDTINYLTGAEEISKETIKEKVGKVVEGL